jgi:hypothetical protein
MADVDMTDAPSNTVAAPKRKGADADSKNDGKKRFEVKKVNTVPDYDHARTIRLTLSISGTL